MIDRSLMKKDIRFGTLAVDGSMVTPRQLGIAVSIQMKEDLNDNLHRFLGEILVELGFMDMFQVKEILERQSRL